MKKFLLFIGAAILAVLLGFFIGNNFLKNDKDESINTKINKENNNLVENINAKTNEEVPTNSHEEKISINTTIKEIIYYNDCNHKIERKITDINAYINMTKEKFQKAFPDWEIKEFNANNVVLYKEENDFCNEHFLVKDEEGYVEIYTIDNDNNILELLDKTDIATKYLAKPDQDNLKKGMIIYTQENLNKLIEDFE